MSHPTGILVVIIEVITIKQPRDMVGVVMNEVRRMIGEFLIEDDPPLDVILAEFISSKESLQTRRSYRPVIVRLLKYLHLDEGRLGDLMTLPLPAVTRQIRVFLAQYLKRDPQAGRPSNPDTYNNRKFILSSFFRYLVLQYEYPKNIIELIPKLQGGAFCRTNSLEEVEAADMLHYFRKKAMLSSAGEEKRTWVRNYLMVYGLFLLALRRGELVAIRWADIDTHQKSLTVKLKGNRGKILPVPEHYLKLLLWYRSKFCGEAEFVFQPFQNYRTNSIDKPVSTNYLYDVVHQAAIAVIRDKKVSPHSFRATFVTWALSRGDDLIIIANATGHSSLNMVRRYDRRNVLENNSINHHNCSYNPEGKD